MFRKASSLVCLLIFKNFFFIYKDTTENSYISVTLASPDVSILSNLGTVVTTKKLTLLTVLIVLTLLEVGGVVAGLLLVFDKIRKWGKSKVS